MVNFKELGIDEKILKVIEQEGFDTPTEIQEKAIPLILEGKDVIAAAKTGSGKTLAFGTGIIQNSVKGRGIQALILTPTRELAVQVAKELKKFSKHKKLKITSVYGGVSLNPQFKALETADVVVGTPGRLLDHMERGTIDLSQVKTLVLDEADRMLDMGFIDDVEIIIKECPIDRQSHFFSATISQEITRLAKRYMNNPVKVSAEVFVDASKLKQVYYVVEDNMKFSLLVHFLRHEHPGMIMIFCNTQKNTDFIARNLKLLGINALAIHGGFSQAKRNQTMENFHSGNFSVLVCTDVAARGLDIKGVTHVYNYDIPRESKQYVHRVGRTARADTEGEAINILASRDYENFDRVLHDNRDMDIVQMETPKVQRVKIGWKPRPTFRGNRNNRRPKKRYY